MATEPPTDNLHRVALLTGLTGLDSLRSCKVIIFGLGGVGSWTAETLARTGIGHLSIVDADTVAASNINRQLPATFSTIGQPKVKIIAQRIIDINPDCHVTPIEGLYTSATASEFNLQNYDYVIDAIDSLADKAQLIIHATSCGPQTRLYSSMGAALKIDPAKIDVAEFWKVTGCPLAAALRRKFKKSGCMPKRKFKCVYSPELIANDPLVSTIPDSSGAMTFGKAATNGALMHITATFGLRLASLVIIDRLKHAP